MTDFFDSNFHLLALLFFCGAILYSSVGHGGASAYLAAMGLLGMMPEEMKPIALVLNIGVSSIALFSFARAGYFDFHLLGPLIAASIPAAFIGGWLESPEPIFRIILSVALFVGAWNLIKAPAELQSPETRTPLILLFVIGGVIGLLSGLVGIGGGIFLTPILIIFRMASAKTAAAVSAAFIAVNSIAGLSGLMTKGGEIPEVAWFLLPCVSVGAWLGARWGSGRAKTLALRRALAAVLIVAATKFLII